MYLLIVFLPLIGSLTAGFLGRFLGRYGASILTITCVFFAFLLSLFSLYEVGFSGVPCYLIVAPWITSGVFRVSWGFLFDSLTCVMLVIVTFVSFLVHLYSTKYMETDPHVPRFMSYLQIFTFFMLVLVTADNLIQMFLGWEGVGISSYLLINFWYTRYWANQSALKALLVNRVGDFALSIGILIIFYIFRSTEYSVIFSMVPFLLDSFIYFLGYKVHSLTLISFFLFLGAVGKSAQLGLHTWLPDAMEGPTPVSALIHAATMVTAGVFLVVRFSPLFEYTPYILFFMIIFGSLTALVASIIGVFQNDLKKIIAYSTCSQLGYMIFCCGLSSYHISMFHLSNHAFFKALLFLCAGSVIHALSDEQDIRKMGSLINFLPLTYSLMLIGSLALIGFPFLTGFYSKDFILEISQVFRYSNIGLTFKSFACWLGNFSVFFTAFYSFRLIYLTFVNSLNSNRLIINKIHESSFLMVLPLIILALGSLFAGFIMKDFFVGIGTTFWGNSIFVYPTNVINLEAEFLPIWLKWLPFCISFLGIFLSSVINIFNYNFYTFYKINYLKTYISFFVSKKWFFDILYNRLIINSLLRFSYLITYKVLDRGFIEILGPYGIPEIVNHYSIKVQNLQSGQITHYLFFMVLGLIIFFFYFVFLYYKLLIINIDYSLIALFIFLIVLN